MKENNLVLCDENNIFFYKLINKEYNLVQKILYYEKNKFFRWAWKDGRSREFTIYFLYHLKNDDLIFCSHSEMKKCKKKK